MLLRRFGPTCVRALALLMFLACPAETRADEWADVRKRVDALAKPLVDGGVTPSLVVGLLRNDRTLVLRYGKASTTGRTVFEIGSITKVFTALLLADLVRDGTVKLSDPLSKYLPARLQLPRTRAITLIDLATHHAGLPRDPPDMPSAPKHNPFKGYSEQRLLGSVAATHGHWRQRGSFSYSNLGAALLGLALSRAAGQAYTALLKTRILEPLGLKDTRLDLDDALGKRCARGFTERGEPVPPWEMGVLAPAAGLRSTADDLLRLLRANMTKPAGTLAKALTMTGKAVREYSLPMEPFTGPDAGRIGFAWLFEKSGLVHHSGQTLGSHSFIGFEPEKKVGAVVLGSSNVEMVTYLGRKLVDLLAGRSVVRLNVTRPVAVPRARLKELEGDFEFDKFILKVQYFDGVLSVRHPPRRVYRLYPSSPTTFFVKRGDAKVTFPDKGSRMLIERDGMKLHGRSMSRRR